MQAILFDLDGTLIDSVYAHTLAWQKALAAFGLHAPAAEIHRRIGLGGRQLVGTIARLHRHAVTDAVVERMEAEHGRLFLELAPHCQPLPGARELLAALREARFAHGIATSGKRTEIDASLRALGIGSDTVVVDGEAVQRAKPEPDILLQCQQRLGVDLRDTLMVGDAIWDMHAARRAGLLAVGLLTGGFSDQELFNAGAARIYRDAAELLASMEELGVHLAVPGAAAGAPPTQPLGGGTPAETPKIGSRDAPGG